MTDWPKELQQSLNKVCNSVAKNLAAGELGAVYGSRNWWSYTDCAEAYFRLSFRVLDEERGMEPTLELASISVQPQWRCYGFTTNLMASLESFSDSTSRVLFVENLVEGGGGNLGRILRRRNYITRYNPYGGVPDMYRLPKDIHDSSVRNQPDKQPGATRSAQVSS